MSRLTSCLPSLVASLGIVLATIGIVGASNAGMDPVADCYNYLDVDINKLPGGTSCHPACVAPETCTWLFSHGNVGCNRQVFMGTCPYCVRMTLLKMVNGSWVNYTYFNYILVDDVANCHTIDDVPFGEVFICLGPGQDKVEMLAYTVPCGTTEGPNNLGAVDSLEFTIQ